MNEQVMAAVQAILHQHKLRAALLCDPSQNGMGQWILETPGVPVLPPFHRNSMLILFDNGEVQQVCEIQPHPTDPEQFPLFQPEQLEGMLPDGRLGIIHGDSLKAVVWNGIRAYHGEIERVELTDAFYRLQAGRTKEQLEQMQNAAKRYDKLFSALPLILQPERTEQAAVVELRFRGMQLGMEAEDLGLLTQVWLTASPQQSHRAESLLTWPGHRLTWGDRINVQVAGLTPEGVHSALGRCYVLGAASRQTHQGWLNALAVQDAAADQLRPGSTLAEAIRQAQKTANSLGVTLEPGGWIHGVGCGWQEYPRNIDNSVELTLEENMTILVAPVISVGEELPYCCMDVYRVTSTGGVRLSKEPRDLIELS